MKENFYYFRFLIAMIDIILMNIPDNCNIDFIHSEVKNRFLISNKECYYEELKYFIEVNNLKQDNIYIKTFDYDKEYNRLNLIIKFEGGK